MGFRQTYKGIFQFKDQTALERAMFENQSEAMGADSMGLQEGFRSESVMLLNIDAVAKEQDWEEMAVAMATLAMHASRGFLYAVAFDRKDGGKSVVEYYEATNGRRKPLPANSAEAPALADDYFPLHEGNTYTFRTSNLEKPVYHLHVHHVEVNGLDYYYLVNPDHVGSKYNEALDMAFFHKDKAQIFSVSAGNEKELHAVDPDNPRGFQLLYNNNSQSGDVLYAIWKAGDYFVVYTHDGNVDLTLPAGTFIDCMKVRVETYHVQEESMSIETQYQYFAKGVGLVKYERDAISLELESYHVAG
jgi:hypothetical protein